MGKKRLPLRTAYISVRVTENVLKEVERIVWSEGYTDIGDYIRNLLRKDFKERGITIKMEESEERKKEPSGT